MKSKTTRNFSFTIDGSQKEAAPITLKPRLKKRYMLKKKDTFLSFLRKTEKIRNS
jgi:hypothetical protein